MDLNDLFNKKKRGFAGITHVLISFVTFEILWLLPVFGFITNTIKASTMIFIVSYWFCVAGAALLPDLDGNESSAGYTLGFLGKLLHIFMVATSSLVYSILHTKKDAAKQKQRLDKSNMQHRMFWHTPLSVALLFFYCYFCYKSVIDQGTLWDMLKAKNFNPQKIFSFVFINMMVVMSFMLASSKLFYNIGRVLFKKAMKYIDMVLVIAFAVFIFFKGTPEYVFQLCTGVALGVLFHIIPGDICSKGSVPLFFPVPIKKQFWFKPKLPFQLETNGTANRILDLVLFIVSIVLMIIIVKGKDVFLNLIK